MLITETRMKRFNRDYAYAAVCGRRQLQSWRGCSITNCGGICTTMLGQQRTPTSAFRRQAARQFVEPRNVVRGPQPLLTTSAENMRGTKEQSILRDDLHGKMQAARAAAMLGQSGCISSWADPPKKKSNRREQIRNLLMQINLLAQTQPPQRTVITVITAVRSKNGNKKTSTFPMT